MLCIIIDHCDLLITDSTVRGSLNFETQFMEEKWSKDVDKLWCDVDLFRNYFNLHKKCVCPINNCKHYKKALAKVLGDRIHDLCLRNIDINIRIHYDVYGK